MILKFEEITKVYHDGVNVTIDLGEFVDAWMVAFRHNFTKKYVAEKLNTNIHAVNLAAIKVEQYVKLPSLRIDY